MSELTDLETLCDFCGGNGFRPNPAAGAIVSSLDSAVQWSRRRLAAVSPNRYHIAILVWDDSLRTFPIVRDALRARGFRIRLLPANNQSSFTNIGGASEAQ